jgi:hypothetical protein
MAKHQGKLSLWLVIGLAVVGGLIFFWPKPQTVPIQEITEVSPNPSPAPILTASSADGEIELKMSQTKKTEAITWTLRVIRNKDEIRRIFWQTMPVDSTLSIPFNSVSPDNKYLFLKQGGSDKTRYIVMTITGEPILFETQTIEFAEKFETDYPEFVITEVTGWGGIDLIVFNTDKAEGGVGPSFWYEIPTRSFIQLFDRFE